MKYLLNILMAMMLLPVFAQEEAFQAANEAYTRQQYEMAVGIYDSLIQEGYANEKLFYNAGNAHFKLNHIASSILNYERALKLNPSHENALYNIELARARTIDKLEQQPELFLSKWLKDIYRSRNGDQWISMALLWAWISLLIGAVFLFVKIKALKQASFFLGILALLVSVSSLGVGLVRQSAAARMGSAIVMTPTAYVKEAPNGQKDLLILHEGTKVEILDEVGDWQRIRIKAISTGKVEGFVRVGQVEKI